MLIKLNQKWSVCVGIEQVPSLLRVVPLLYAYIYT